MSRSSTESAHERGRILELDSSPRAHAAPARTRSHRARRSPVAPGPYWPATGPTAAANASTDGALALLDHPAPDAAPTLIPGAARQHILIVEDDSHVASVIRASLELEGEASWTVQSAGEGLRALELAGATPPDVVLLDVRLPGLGGAEVYRRLRTGQQTRGARILFLSAGTAFDLHQLGIEDGVLLRKPFDVRDLVSLVRVLLQG